MPHVMFTFPRSSNICCTGTRRYRTSPNSRRIYGPSPSDVRPILQAISNNISCPSGPSPTVQNKSKSWRWSDEARSKLRENFTKCHPLNQWRLRDPATFSKMVSDAITKVREKESQVMLLELLTSSKLRTLALWNPDGFKPRYRISLFSGRFFFKMPGELPDPDRETYDGRHTVFISVSISPSLQHPYSARRRKRKDHSPLNSIGIRVSGKHPITGDPFDTWTLVGDAILQRIIDIANSFEDQAEFREICIRSLPKG